MKENENKKKILLTVSAISLISGTLYLLNKNREMEGIIKNQKITIDGLTKEIQKMSYHLGKTRRI